MFHTVISAPDENTRLKWRLDLFMQQIDAMNRIHLSMALILGYGDEAQFEAEKAELAAEVHLLGKRIYA